MADNPSSPPSPSPSSPLTIDGWDSDAALAKSEYLSRREVLERRSRRCKQLARIYREELWALMELLKVKHREYYWIYGKSPFKDENQNSNSAAAANSNEDNGNCNGKLGLGLDDIKRCQVAGCKTKAMALTRFCHVHILSDPKQKLYKGCTYVLKSMPAGPLFCNKPILRSTVPCLCPNHYQRSEKCLVRDLRKAGLNVNSVSKVAPKFHVIIAEYVSQIQSRRRASQKAIVGKVEPM